MTATELNNLLLRVEILARSNWIHAMHLLCEAEDLYPQDPRIPATRGLIYFENHNYKEASKSYQRAFELGSRDIQVLYMLGNSYFVQGEFRLALIYYNQITNQSVELCYNKALALSNLGRVGESIKLLQEALHNFPPQIYVYIMLADQYIRLNDIDQALKTVQDAEKRLGPSPGLYALKGTIYAKQKNWLQSYAAFRKADSGKFAIFPDHFGLYANAAAMSGFIDEAIELFEHALVYMPYSETIYEDYCRAVLENDREDLAKKIISRARKHLLQLSPALRLMQQRISPSRPKP